MEKLNIISGKDKLVLNIKNEKWRIDNYNKPLKSVSSYTIKDLHEICNKLNIPLKYHNIINKYISTISNNNKTYVPLLDNLGIPIKYHTIINNYVKN